LILDYVKIGSFKYIIDSKEKVADSPRTNGNSRLADLKSTKVVG